MKIYTIYKATNLINGKIYIGFDSNWPDRQKNHKRKHNNPKCNEYNGSFHRALRKYGWDNFSWEPIYQSKDKNHVLKEMERHFIEQYRTFYRFEDCNGYNLTLGGEGIFGNDRNAKKTFEFIDPDGNKIIIKNLREYCRDNNLCFTAMWQVYSEKRKYYMGYKNINFADYTPRGQKEYKLYNENNELVVFNNIKKFCEENQLNDKKLSLVLKGKQESHKGYTLNIKENKEYSCYDPNGNIITFNSISQFCKENNLTYSNMLKLVTNKKKYYKGYRNINHSDYTPKPLIKYKLIDPNDNIIEFNNIDNFSRENGLHSSDIKKVLIGERKSHKGYRLVENKEYKQYKLIDKNNNIHTFYSIKEFCIQNNLFYGGMIKLISGDRKSYRGFRLLENTNYISYNEREYKIISPKGEVIVFKNIPKFAKENALNANCLNKLFRGDLKSYRGYTAV